MINFPQHMPPFKGLKAMQQNNIIQHDHKRSVRSSFKEYEAADNIAP